MNKEMKLSKVEKGIYPIGLVSKNPKGSALVDMSKVPGFHKNTLHRMLPDKTFGQFMVCADRDL